MRREPTDTGTEEKRGVGIPEPGEHPGNARTPGVSDATLDEEKEYERLNPGSGAKTPSVPGRPDDLDNA